MSKEILFESTVNGVGILFIRAAWKSGKIKKIFRGGIMIDAKEMIRFEQAFNCKGLFEEKHALGIALILTRIFVYAMTCEGYKYSVIARSINKSRPMIYAYLVNTTDIEKSLALEFIGNDDYKYNGFLGNY